MILPDVNVLIYAFRSEARDHARYHDWLTRLVRGASAFAVSELVLSGFLRISTHPRIYRVPAPLDRALEFVERIVEQPTCRVVRPGPRHWEIFIRLCRETGARGPLIPDAYFAALAIEHGCEWITCDTDFARFEGLRWRHPLA